MLGEYARKGRHVGKLEERMRAGCKKAARVATAPLPLVARAELCAAMVVQGGTYGCAVHQVAPSNELRLRRSVTRAVWGAHHAKRCPEIVLTLHAKGHRVDPAQAAAFQRIMTLQRMLQQDAALADEIRPAWDASRDAAGYTPGPVGCVRASLQRIGWGWPSPTRLQPPAPAPAVDLAEAEPGRLAHEVREALRRAE
eukprot:gene6236-3584_t